MLLNHIISLLVGYFFGCISTGYIVGRFNNIDIRNYGSGNAGTTNALRTLGKKAAIITLFGDMLKAIIPVLLFRYIFHATGEEYYLIALYTGLGVMLGHNYPFWLSFKGGKGVATSAAVIIVLDYRMGIIAAVLFFIIIGITRYVSLASIITSFLFPIGILVFHNGDIHMLILSCLFTISVIYMHRSNIKRLLNGTENKLGQKVDINNKNGD